MTRHDSAASFSGRRSPLTPRAMLEVKRLSEPRMHPDGERIAFVVTEPDFEESLNTSHIWLTEWPIEADEDESGEDHAGSGETAEPGVSEDESPGADDLTRQLTYSRDGEEAPRWSPDGRYLAFLSARPDPSKSEDDEDEEPAVQVWVLPSQGGEARCITEAKEGVLDYAWRPDSATILYVAPEPRPRAIESVRKEERDRRKIDPIVEHEELLLRQFWQVDVEDGKPIRLHTADYGVSEFALSPDGARLIYTSNRTGDPNDYHIGELTLVSLPGGEQRALPDRPGDKTHLRWSPNGEMFTFLSWLDPALSFSRQCLYGIDLSDASPPGDYRLLTDPAFDFDLTCYEWCTEDNAIYAVAAVGTGSELVRIAGARTERISADNGIIMEDLALDPDGGAMVFVSESVTTFPEIVGRDMEGSLLPLTRLNTEIAALCRLPRQEVVSWTSADGTPVEGVLTYPDDYRAGVPAPMIVDIHGGPKGRAMNRLRSYSFPPVWAAEGYAVLRPNFRGSEGYGNGFAIANRRDLGGGDFADIMAGVDWAIAQGIADPDRLGVMGGSYGGYMTNWAIGHTDRFKAAISMFGIFHLQTDYSNSELSRWDNDYLGAYYWEDPEIFRRLSPGSYLTNIKTPTLILHGDEDTNTVLSNSRELYQALRHRGVTTQFVHYPRESHGLNEPNHRLDEIRRCLAWMDRHVRGDGKSAARYRVGDSIPNPGGLELRVTGVEVASFAGQPDPVEKGEGDSQVLLEASFTIHSSDTRRGADPMTLALTEIRLESAEREQGDSCLTPVGVPLESAGGKVLVEGENMRLTQHPSIKTGQFGFGFGVVFRVPKSGERLLYVADFPPAAVHWAAADEETAAGS